LAILQSGATINGKGKEKVGYQEQSMNIRKTPGQDAGRRKAAWRKPPQGWAKINTDAGFCPDTEQASIRVIARGHESGVLLTA
jgi:hypothetical protein